MGELALARGANRHLDDAVRRLAAELSDVAALPLRARRLVELMALTLQGALLVRHAPAAVSDAFCASRLAGGGHSYGTLPAAISGGSIVPRRLDRSDLRHKRCAHPDGCTKISSSSTRTAPLPTPKGS